MNPSLAKTGPQASATRAWQCVVEPDHVFREMPSGVLHEVTAVRWTSPYDADVTLRKVDSVGSDVCHVLASMLCAGNAWERLPEQDADTVIWGGGTKVGPVGAR